MATKKRKTTSRYGRTTKARKTTARRRTTASDSKKWIKKFRLAKKAERRGVKKISALTQQIRKLKKQHAVAIAKLRKQLAKSKKQKTKSKSKAKVSRKRTTAKRRTSAKKVVPFGRVMRRRSTYLRRAA